MNRPSSWKWWITGLLLLATTINYMDRVTLANASVRVTQEFGLSEQQYGNLELAFGWAFAAGSLVFGFMADRFRVYWLYPCVLAGWSVMGMISGWTESYTQLLVCRTALGFFEAGHWPCALKTTFALLSEKDRTMGNSVLQGGASIGAIITPQVMKLLMTEQVGSWRSAFVVVGAFGLLWVVVWLIMMRGSGLDNAPRQASNSQKRGLNFSDLLANICDQFVALVILFAGSQAVALMVYVLSQRMTSKEWSPQLEAIRSHVFANIVLILLAWWSFIIARKKLVKSQHQCIFVASITIVAFLIAPYFGVGWWLFGTLLVVAMLSPEVFVIICSRNFWALALLITGTQTVWHIYRVWMMKFLQTGRGYTEAAALDFQSAYYISTDVGCFLAGLISLWLIRKRSLSAHDSRRWVYAGACLLTSLSVMIPSLEKGWPLLGVLLIIGAGALALFPCYYSFVQELSAHHVGRLTGLLSMWVWAVTSPLHKLFGWIADTTHSYDQGLVIAGLAPWLGVAAMKWLWVKRPEVA